MDSHFYLPFTDEENEGIFKNIYTNSTFDNSLFLPNSPSRDRGSNCLAWEELGKGAVDKRCENQLSSVCEGKPGGRPYVARGFCPESKIDIMYYPLENTWRSNGPNIAVVQFIQGDQLTDDYYMLTNLRSIASAKIIVRYVMLYT